MSTSLLYHAFGIQGYKYFSTQFKGGSVIFRIKEDPTSLRCPVCRSRHITRKGSKERWFRSVPIGKMPVWIVLSISRVGCVACDLIRQMNIKFASPRLSYTKAFERYVLELSRHMTIKDVARHLNVSWDIIKNIQKKSLSRRFARPKLGKLRRIAIDEISIGKNHKYLTIVLDLKTGAVVFVGDGKGADALLPFWRRLKRSKARIKAVAMDMSPAYISAIQEYLPRSTIVFDHFHIVKLFNEKLSELRRKLYHQLTEQAEKELLKGTRWLLLKNPENLDADRNEHQRLQEALQLNLPLATAYYLKEDLRQLWRQSNKKTAEKFLNDWAARARASGIRILIKFANTLCAHRTGILAFYDYPISTGPLEGTNNKIKTMKRQAYGFRDMEFFKLKILALHQTRYALVG
jgi:transposase